MKKLLLSLLALPLFALSAQAAPAATPLTRADVEAIIQQYLENNGEKVIESIALYQEAQQRQQVSKLIGGHTPTKGPADAPITIIEFSDFECPFCLKVQPTLKAIERRYPGKIRWAYKHLPLSFHKMAPPAAYAAMAAHQQGKFWQYSEQLWKRQEFLGDKLFTDIAAELKLDMKKFNADRASKNIQAMVQMDAQQADSIGARGTPYFLVNGTALSGALPESEFVRVIENALKQQ
jgi:protein-disulfide isomerase